MSSTTVTRHINAPIERVFDTVADIDNFSKAVSNIVRVEYLSEVKSGVGTRFRETRSMHGREATVELEVTEYVANERVRIVSDTHGTVWDTVFTVATDGDGTTLTLMMDARAYKLSARLMNRFATGMIKKALANDMDAVKRYCEAAAG